MAQLVHILVLHVALLESYRHLSRPRLAATKLKPQSASEHELPIVSAVNLPDSSRVPLSQRPIHRI